MDNDQPERPEPLLPAGEDLHNRLNNQAVEIKRLTETLSRFMDREDPSGGRAQHATQHHHRRVDDDDNILSLLAGTGDIDCMSESGSTGIISTPIAHYDPDTGFETPKTNFVINNDNELYHTDTLSPNK